MSLEATSDDRRGLLGLPLLQAGAAPARQPCGVAAREAASRCAMEVAFEPGFLRISRFAGGRTRLCPALAREMLKFNPGGKRETKREGLRLRRPKP
jgi:hypothetical protein